MAQHPHPCDICAQLRLIQAKQHPRFVAELPTAFLILGESQQWRGYCVLLCRTPVPDLEDLSWTERLEFLRDLALCSEAVSNVVSPRKMNVESLGNVVPHLHFHLFPRQEAELSSTQPVWVQQNDGTPFDLARDGELLEQLRREVERLTRERL